MHLCLFYVCHVLACVRDTVKWTDVTGYLHMTIIYISYHVHNVRTYSIHQCLLFTVLQGVTEYANCNLGHFAKLFFFHGWKQTNVTHSRTRGWKTRSHREEKQREMSFDLVIYGSRTNQVSSLPLPPVRERVRANIARCLCFRRFIRSNV